MDRLSTSTSVPRWLVPAFVAPAVLFLIGLAADLEVLRLTTKALPVLALAFGVWLTRPRPGYRVLVSVALLLGAAGDVLLEIDLFEFGLAAFLIGHLFYIGAFLGDAKRPGPLEALPFAVWGIALVAILAEGAGDLLVPVAVYAAVLCAMMWRALTRMKTVNRITGVTTAIGAVLFGLSDSIIALDRFGPGIAGSAWMIILTYWSAQALLAFGALSQDTR